MTYKIKVKTITEREVTTLVVNAQPRYWEDSTLNGIDETDEDPKMPCRQDDLWVLKIDLKTGLIMNWPEGNRASIHYKVADAGTYELWDNDELITVSDGYVPSILCPKGNGYGDYIIMDIKEDGTIENWKVDLSYFEKEKDEDY